MSVNSDYLPFKSARQYQDRKMAKWMGFFLSEHTSALGTSEETFDFSEATPLNEKINLLSQLFSTELEATFSVKQGKRVQVIKVKITQFVDSKIGLATGQGYQFVAIDDVLKIQVLEKEEDAHDES